MSVNIASEDWVRWGLSVWRKAVRENNDISAEMKLSILDLEDRMKDCRVRLSALEEEDETAGNCLVSAATTACEHGLMDLRKAHGDTIFWASMPLAVPFWAAVIEDYRKAKREQKGDKE
ncbi:hypothetical protein [Corynebacterium terpenotabidum]|uniref:Uncharacterized protein n=1 Tax=Corynebacterium terpenotabidum Y-11 TaxID=1200352 RepID=S4XB50_9CORY|nr:hypothetical protein [Corynebacterium terpenotabidum]AGP29689.1 hypothetical protein A606_00155 [Corynebacterium terpenotabidum Y-11]